MGNPTGAVALTLFVAFTLSLFFHLARLAPTLPSRRDASRMGDASRVVRPLDGWIAAAVGVGSVVAGALASWNLDNLDATILVPMAGVAALGGGGLVTRAAGHRALELTVIACLALLGVLVGVGGFA